MSVRQAAMRKKVEGLIVSLSNPGDDDGHFGSTMDLLEELRGFPLKYQCSFISSPKILRQCNPELFGLLLRRLHKDVKYVQDDVGRNLLHKACNNSFSLDKIPVLLDTEGEHNLEYKMGADAFLNTPLMLAAAQENSTEAVKILLKDAPMKYRFMQDKSGDTVLMYATGKQANVETLKLLLEGTEPSFRLITNSMQCTCLHRVCYLKPSPEIIKVLLKDMPLEFRLLKDHMSATALLCASGSQCDPKVIEYLLEDCPKHYRMMVDNIAMTPLMRACAFNAHPKTVELLLKDMPKSYREMTSKNGANALLWAFEIEMGHSMETIELLLKDMPFEYRMSVDGIGETALMKIAGRSYEKNCVPIIKLLLDGMPRSYQLMRNDTGNDALTIACLRSPSLEVVKLLTKDLTVTEIMTENSAFHTIPLELFVKKSNIVSVDEVDGNLLESIRILMGGRNMMLNKIRRPVSTISKLFMGIEAVILDMLIEDYVKRLYVCANPSGGIEELYAVDEIVQVLFKWTGLSPKNGEK
eukprot:TRINITY_DN108707_c0_g1_i1.p1 TRINITY_DN108707_c0_g1~~TRINITY_DN108707_c0_g1_i1.p1  ORF type:complete len:525 (-),score=105.51 TRINITY_DN108707_c0_g1_i1:554-2128(-)